MKVSISLPQADLAFLDEFAANHGLDSRSAAFQRAVQALRALTLVDDYHAAWTEWSESGDAELWDSLVGDGLSR